MIVFREGLEAVLILAALMASMVGAQRRYRRPLLGGVGLALGASVVTWVVAQTVLGSLARYGERLEAIVSLVAIGMLLLILNWFYHRVYWQEHLAELHGRKKSIMQGAGSRSPPPRSRARRPRLHERVPRGVRDRALPAGADARGRRVDGAGGRRARLRRAVVGVFFLVIALERKLPHKKMLIATGLMITWVLVVLVGQTVQTLQKVGWVPVTPIEGLDLPYWGGLWLGLYPTWEGLVAQAGGASRS